MRGAPPRLAPVVARVPQPSPPGRLAGRWFRADGAECGRSFRAHTGDTRWLEWNDVGRVVIAHDTIEISPNTFTTDLSNDELLRRFHRDLAPIVLQALGWQAMHGSACAQHGRAVLMCGTSGSGKSTLAFAMRRAGFHQLADDNLVLTMADGSVRLWPQSFSPRLRPASARFFGETANNSAHVSTADQSGAPVLARGPGESPAPVSPLLSPHAVSALVLVEQRADLERPIECVPIAPADAFVQVLPHAHCFDPAEPTETARLTHDYMSLVSRVPVYALRYRPSWEVLPQLVSLITDLALAEPHTPSEANVARSVP